MCSGRSLSRDLHAAFSVKKTCKTIQTRAAMHCWHTIKQKCTRRRCNIMSLYFIIHSYCLVILLDFSFKMRQIDAFKYEIIYIFLRGTMPPDPPRGGVSFSSFSPLTRFHDWYKCIFNWPPVLWLHFTLQTTRWYEVTATEWAIK